MTVVKAVYNSPLLLSVVVMVLSSLACTQSSGFATFTPAPTNTAVSVSIPPTSSPPPTATAEPTRDAQTAIVRQALVNLRDAPNGKVIGSLSAGQSVEVVTVSGDWAQIAEPPGWVWVGCLEGMNEKGCEAK